MQRLIAADMSEWSSLVLSVKYSCTVYTPISIAYHYVQGPILPTEIDWDLAMDKSHPLFYGEFSY